MSPLPEERVIRVVLIGSGKEALGKLVQQLTPYPQINIVGSTTDSEDGLSLVRRALPHLVLSELNTRPHPGIETAKRISIQFPDVATILLASQSGIGFFQEAMRVGASDFLVQPLNSEDLVDSIAKVRALQRERERLGPRRASTIRDRGRAAGKIIVVASGKGGAGKTFVSTALASVLATQFSEQVVLVDLSLQFGDVGTFLKLSGGQRTMRSLASVIDELQPESLENVLQVSPTSLRVLLAPGKPEEADAFQAREVDLLLDFIRQQYPVTVIDTSSYFDDVLLVALREADLILVVTTPDIPALADNAKFLSVLGRLRYLPDKACLLLNRQSPTAPMDEAAIARHLSQRVVVSIPDDPDTVNDLLRGGKQITDYPRAASFVAVTELAKAVDPWIQSARLTRSSSVQARPQSSRRKLFGR